MQMTYTPNLCKTRAAIFARLAVLAAAAGLGIQQGEDAGATAQICGPAKFRRSSLVSSGAMPGDIAPGVRLHPCPPRDDYTAGTTLVLMLHNHTKTVHGAS